MGWCRDYPACPQRYGRKLKRDLRLSTQVELVRRQQIHDVGVVVGEREIAVQIALRGVVVYARGWNRVLIAVVGCVAVAPSLVGVAQREGPLLVVAGDPLQVE